MGRVLTKCNAKHKSFTPAESLPISRHWTTANPPTIIYVVHHWPSLPHRRISYHWLACHWSASTMGRTISGWISSPKIWKMGKILLITPNITLTCWGFLQTTGTTQRWKKTPRLSAALQFIYCDYYIPGRTNHVVIGGLPVIVLSVMSWTLLHLRTLTSSKS